MSQELAVLQERPEPLRITREAIARRPSEVTVGEVIQRFGSKKDQRFSDRIAAALGTVPLSELDQAAADSYAGKLYRHCTDSTRRRQFYTPLISALRRAAKVHWCDTPVIRPPEAGNASPPAWIRPLVFDRLVQFAPKHLVRQMHLLVGTGMRPREMFCLRWEHIHLDENVIELPNSIVLIRPHVRAVVEQVPRTRHKEVILTEDHEPYAPKSNGGGQSKSAVYRLRERSGYSEFGLAHLQHSFAVWHLALHRDWKLLKSDSGWSDYRLRWTRALKDAVLDSVRDELLHLHEDPPPGILSAGLFATPNRRGR